MKICQLLSRYRRWRRERRTPWVRMVKDEQGILRVEFRDIPWANTRMTVTSEEHYE